MLVSVWLLQRTNYYVTFHDDLPKRLGETICGRIITYIWIKINLVKEQKRPWQRKKGEKRKLKGENQLQSTAGMDLTSPLRGCIPYYLVRRSKRFSINCVPLVTFYDSRWLAVVLFCLKGDTTNAKKLLKITTIRYIIFYVDLKLISEQNLSYGI